ncbi:MAG: BolA family transcriptional regulator [Alphaproteobacteria bacterium]|nr:BolA family transcriptional regulator [Alphaproteobacteria bacterium]
MGPLATRIHTALHRELAAEHIELVDESHMHSGPAAETHFNLVVVSETFDGKRLVARQRLVYGALAAELRDGVHALTMKTLTPAEFSAAAGPVANVSPACRGGSKAD